jgi:hypothetical protein
MQVDGKCFCGEITFQAEVDPNHVHICHCTDCQNLTGTAYRVTAAAPRDSFKLLTGKPKTFDKIAEDGTKSAQAFCPNCGSPIYSAHEGGSTYGLRSGCLKQRAELVPRKQIWCRSALSWPMNIEAIPKLQKDE